MDEIYMWYMFVWIYLSWWNVKKIKNYSFGSLCRVLHSAKDPFAQCNGHNTRQSWKNGCQETHFFSFAECCDHGTRQRIFLKKIQTLPSAGQRALGKEFFLKKKSKLCRAPDRGHLANNFFKKNKKSLPSALWPALGKVWIFLKKKIIYRVPSGRHSAKFEFFF